MSCFFGALAVQSEGRGQTVDDPIRIGSVSLISSQSPPAIGSGSVVEPISFRESISVVDLAPATRDEVEEKLSAQAKQIDDLKSKVGGLVQMGHSNESMKLSGRIHIDEWGFPDVDSTLFPLEGGDPQDRFGFRRLRFGVAGKTADNLLYKIEMEFAEGNNPSFRDAYLGFSDLPFFQTILIGNQKRPYGLDHLNSSRYNVFIERPLIIEAFNQDSRRLGIAAYGFSADKRYNWAYGVYNQRLTQGIGLYIGDHYQPELTGRLATTAWYDEVSGGRGYLHFAVAGSVGFPDGTDPTGNEARYRTRPEARSSNRWYDTGRIAGAEDTLLVGLESVLNLGPLQLVGELQSVDVNRSAGSGPDLQFGGGYLYAAYFLTGEHMPWDRERGTLDRIVPFENFFCVRDCDGCRRRGLGAWQVAARYSYADLTDDNIIGGQGSAVTMGLNWYWSPYARWQFNYIWGDLNREPAGGGQYNILGMRFCIDF